MALLQKQFENFQQYCEGTLGVYAQHIETGKLIQFNAEQSFLMCSTYKLPMAIYLLHKIERGDLQLNDLYEVTAFDLRPGGSATLTQFDYSIAQAISIHNLLKFMLQESCNSSTDIILRLIGGPAAVTRYMEQIGIQEMRIDRYTLEALAAWDGIKNIPADHRITLKQYTALEKSVSPDDLIKAKTIFQNDIQDTTTPAAMTVLLVKLFKNELLTTEHTEFLLNIMRGCKRGPLRLMGLLPPKTPVAHKTGTLTGYTCDIGIITLPHQTGHIALSAYIKNSKKDLTKNERVLAEIGRTVYDGFLLN